MLFKYYNALTNASGDSLVGYAMRLFGSNGAQVPLFSDENGTPIISVSGQADTAISDDDGMIRFYVESGTYDIRKYDRNDAFIGPIEAGVPMIRGLNEVELADPTGAERVGTPTGTVQGDIDARPTAASLASPTGGEMVGFSHDATNDGSTIGQRLRQDIYITDAPWSAKCDYDGATGLGTNDLAAIQACIDDAPVGARIIIPGPAYITDTLTVTKRVSLICTDDAAAIIVNVGTAKDGVVIGPGTGPGDSFGRTCLRLNVYGAANSCRNGLVLRRVDRSDIDVNVSVGTIQTKDGLVDDEGFGVVLWGCLQDNGVRIQSSVNYRPPYASLVAAFQRDHVLLKKDTDRDISNQAADFMLNLEGGRHGLVTRASPGEGKAVYSGTIQGLTGRPLYIINQTQPNMTAMWLEQNALAPYFLNCAFPVVDDVQLTGPTQAAATMVFENCLRPIVSLLYGEASFDSNCTCPIFNGTLTQFPRQMPVTGGTFFDGAEQTKPSFGIDTTAISYGGEGMASLRNVHENPFVDVWPEVGSAYAIPGIAGGAANAIIDKETNAVFPQGLGVECKVTIGTAGATKGALITSGGVNALWTGRPRWVSFMLWLRLRAANTAGKNLRVRVGAADDVAGMEHFCDVTAREVYAVRGGFHVAAGKIPAILVTMHDGANYVTGIFDIGGVSMVNGPRAPKYIEDSLERHELVLGSIAAPPSFQFQKAVVAGDAYVAVGTASNADWKKVTP